MDIEGSESMSGTRGNVVARYNHEVVTPTWSITSGNSHATIGNDGTITILSSGSITVQATYNNYTTTKNISLAYVANTYSETIIDEAGSVVCQTCRMVQNQDGSTTTTSRGTCRREDGYRSGTESTSTESQDGSSTSTSTTTNPDGSYSETQSSTSAPDPETGTTTT